MKRQLKGHGAGRWGPTATGEFSTANPKGFIEQTIHAKKSIPGSAHYNPRSVRPRLGSKFSSSFPKNDVDWKIYTAKKIPGIFFPIKKRLFFFFFVSSLTFFLFLLFLLFLPLHSALLVFSSCSLPTCNPGPGQYKQVPLKKLKTINGHSGKFNNSMPLTDVDRAMRRSAMEPGPLEYCTSFRKMPARGTGRFSTSVLPTFSDVQKNYTIQNPGPGQYVQDFVRRPRKGADGEFSKSKVPGYIEHRLRLVGTNPSPVNYQHHNYDRAICESYGSSKFLKSNPKSDVDWLIHRASFIPGPGQYNPAQPFRSDVLHSSGACFSMPSLHNAATTIIRAPRSTLSMKCYNGELAVPTEIVGILKRCGVWKTMRTFTKQQARSIVATIDTTTVGSIPPGEEMSTADSKQFLERVQQQNGAKCVPLVKLVASMLRQDGQIERAIEIMKTAVVR
jgi:hypothetical protein